MNYRPRKTYNGKPFFDAIRDLPTKKLTVKPIDWVYHPYKSDSPFEEIKLDKYVHSPKIRRLKRELKQIDPVNGKFEKQVYRRLVKIIRRSWSDGYNIVAHSGGYDSRLLSTIIKELGYRNVIFFECGGESREFKRIMQLQGFGHNQIVVYNETVQPDKYFEYSFSFDPGRFNGLSGYPVNIFYDPYKDAVERGILPENATIFSGYGGYIEKMFQKYGFDRFFRRDYYGQLSTFNFYGNWVIPFFDFDYIKELAKYRRIHRSKKRTTDRLCEVYCKHLRSVPNPDVNKDLFKRGYRQWDRRKIEYSHYWGKWQLNEMIKYLQTQNYIINGKTKT